MVTTVKGSSFSVTDNMAYVSLFDTGAIGDGVADDTAAIAAAIALATDAGITIYVPPGTFLTDPVVLPLTSTMFGVGDMCILKLKGNNTSALLNLESGSSCSYMQVDGNKSNQTVTTAHTVQIASATKVTLHGVTSVSAAGHSVSITGYGQDISVTACDLSGFMKTGLTIEQGLNITLNTIVAHDSDGLASPGDGFALAPIYGDAAVQLVTMSDLQSYNNTGRGFAFLGVTTKNVSSITMSTCIASNNNSHGFHTLLVLGIIGTGCISKANRGDGIRLEGDTEFCRFVTPIADGNTGYGIREVVSGSTPNNNGIVYGVSINNVASNTVTMVGAASWTKNS